MASDEEVKAFVEKVIEMRRVQKDFIRTRKYASMQLSKQLEKDIDDRAKKLLAKINGELEEKEAAQPGLFSEEQ